MTENPQTFTRQDIHALVWSAPMRDVAKSLNISDVGLAKVCVRMNIPRPKQEHWLRAKQGRHVGHPPLPYKGFTQSIFSPPSKQEKKEKAAPKTVALPAVVSSTKRHPLVGDCQAKLRKASINDYGRLISRRDDVNMSKQALPRVLDILNTVLRTLEKLGHTAVYSDKYNGIELCIDSQNMRIAINETSRRIPHVVSKKEQLEIDRRGYSYAPRWDYVPTGILTLSLSGRGLYGCRSVWKDLKSTPIETNLPMIVQGVLTAAAWIDKSQKEHARREKAYQLRLRRQNRLELAAELTQVRISRVDALINGWVRSREIKQFLSAVEGNSTGTASTAANRRLLRYARELARDYDPLDSFELRVRK